jgi:hypothetical protein
MENKDFTIFILSHGRADKVHTVEAIRKAGYTGSFHIVIDNEDKTADKYYSKYGEKVVMFDKADVASRTDEFDNFGDRRTIIYARNACFEIAEKLGIKYFLQFDDDYTGFYYKLVINGDAVSKPITDLGAVIQRTLDYYKATPALTSIAFAQGGDFIGGIDNGAGIYRFSQRKAMNSFFCSTERPFKFIGRINEDVNTYTSFQSKGNIFLTVNCICLMQKATQKNKGGMSEMYLSSGTYVKSFYSVICAPSAVTISQMKTSNGRLHHSIDWERVVPMILDEKHKK